MQSKTKTSSSLSFWSVKVGVSIIHISLHEIPLILYYACQGLSHQSLKVAVALHKPKNILFHYYKLDSHANPVFSLSCFGRGTCRKAGPRYNVVKSLASANFERPLSIRGIRYCPLWLYGHHVQVAFFATESQLSSLKFWPWWFHKPQVTSRVLSSRIRAAFLFLLGTPPIYEVSCASLPPRGKRRILQFEPTRRYYNNKCPLYLWENFCVPN